MAYLGPVVVLFGFGQVPAHAGDPHFCHAADGALRDPRHPHGLARGHRGRPHGGMHFAAAPVEGRVACRPADVASRSQPGGHADPRHGGDRIARRRFGPRPEAPVFAPAIADRQGHRAGHRHHPHRHRARPADAGLRPSRFRRASLRGTSWLEPPPASCSFPRRACRLQSSPRACSPRSRFCRGS